MDEPVSDYVTHLPQFKTWVKEHLSLAAIQHKKDAEELTQKAIRIYKEPLFDWLRLNGAEIYTLPEGAIWDAEKNQWDY